ncbi:copper amine oxidase [Pelosinus baikalensis]|uniref:Copper amine oxidase n=1 Tax=Pelosinus baikalensis TaxID=2892015 RepID=A0ABS8HXA3_9FIRM|nr:copper amine oxidase [Pelosinus baikalensis]MCC5467592.1 copper amine oxidase [Pelosinus baikalensis]
MNWIKFGIVPLIMFVTLHSTALAVDTYSTVKLDGLTLPEWPVVVSPYGGKLVLSDSPEMVSNDGIMYQDTVSGDIRLFFHHVNATEVPKKIVVLLENYGKDTAHITVVQHGLGGPSLDYLQVGKEVQQEYLEGGNLYLIEVPCKESRSLISSLDHSIVEPNMLVNGMYDLKIDHPVIVRVMMMPLDADIAEFAAKAKVLPADPGEHRLRGTFEGKDRLIVGKHTYDGMKSGSVAVTLADNHLDQYVRGIDATDGTPTLNYGNYGIVYKIYLPSTSGDEISYYLNPRGGEYAGWLGLEYRHQDVHTIPTPADIMSFGSNKISESAYLGTYESGKSLWMTFSPPGASNLPIKLILEPEKVK